MMKICAVIVTYNRLEKLQHTLSAYLTAGIDHLVIINNASTDNTKEYLDGFVENEANIPVDLIHSTKNSGGAGGFYLGLKIARQLDHIDWIVTSDDDSYPEQNALTQFKSQFAITNQQTPTIVASAVYFPDLTICPMNQPMIKVTALTAWQHARKGQKWTGLPIDAYGPNKQTTPILASSFVGMFIHRQVLSQAEVLPNKDFFLYWDDIDFCLRLVDATQGVIIFAPSVLFYHDCHRNSVTIEGQRLYYMVRNGIRTIKNLPPLLRYCSFLIKVVGWLMQAYQTQSLKWFWRALRDYINGH